MKLTCEAVKDIYVLYQEDELHPSVRKAVDEHLEFCEQCRDVYETGDKFYNNIEINKVDQSLLPSSKLENDIRLKLKLRRMRMIVLFIVSIVIVFSFFQYINDRRNLLYEISSTEETLRELSFQLDMVKREETPTFLVSTHIMDLNENTNRIERHLNLYEKARLKRKSNQLNLNFNLEKFIFLLHERYKHGKWTEQDEFVLTQMIGYFDEYSRKLTDVRLTLNGIDSYSPKALLGPFPGEELKEISYQVNHLTYTYGRFQKLPNEVNILTKEAMIERARTVFNEPKAKIIFLSADKHHVETNGTYTVSIEGETGQYYTTWEAYTGRLLDFNNQQLSEKGELLSENIIEDKLREYVPRLLNTDQYRVIKRGLNYNYHSNVDHKLYTYEIIPTHDSYDTNTSFRIFIDARTSELAGLIPLQHPYYSELPFSTMGSFISEKEALKVLQENYQEVDFTFTKVQYIPSLLTNQYELVYLFEGIGKHGETLDYLINTRTGKEDEAY